jgi:DNA-binding NarL/FixJ family response regulator
MTSGPGARDRSRRAVALLERENELAAITDVVSRTGILVIEGGAGLGKTSLLDAARQLASVRGRDILDASCSELEADFPYGVVRQLFERRLAEAGAAMRDELLSGPASTATRVLLTSVAEPYAFDTSFAVLHGLYWLAAHLAEKRPLALLVDDVHWADTASLRFLAHLAPRVDGLALALVVARRPTAAEADPAWMQTIRDHAVIVRPRLLTDTAVGTIVREELGGRANAELCRVVTAASGGNPFYVSELVGAARRSADGQFVRDDFRAISGAELGPRLITRIRAVDEDALPLARTLAVLGDGCSLNDAAALSGVEMTKALTVATGLVRVEVLSDVDPPRFLHPIIRDAIEWSMGDDDRAHTHRAAAQLLFAHGATAGRIGAHAQRCHPSGDPWVVARLRETAGAAMQAGAPAAAAALLRRALAEPPPADDRIAVLRALARAEVSAGRDTACEWLEEAMALASDRVARAEIAIEAAETYAALFRWLDGVHVIERARRELGADHGEVGTRLDAELVVSALHDARCAPLVTPALERLDAATLTGFPAEARGVALGMAMVLQGAPADEAAAVLEQSLAGASSVVANWDVRAALLWSLVAAERYATVETALEPLLAQVHESGSTRGLVAVYSSLAFLKLRVGALPEADAAARTALAVLRAGDFAPGLAFGATVLADVAIEAGMVDEASALLELLPIDPGPAGVGAVLVPAARGRLHLALGHGKEALDQFGICSAMFSPQVWGIELRDVGYLHARSGAAQALLLLGRRDEAVVLARAELDDVTAFGAHRAVGVAARVTGLATGGERGLEFLEVAVAAHRASPALIERAKSLLEYGAALRRARRRRDARAPLAEALDLAARAGARPLADRARAELIALGARPRREHQWGVESLTPSEWRVAELAADGASNRDIAYRLYVTVKTVEGHLAHVYTKLGISGRPELRQTLSTKSKGRDPVVDTHSRDDR